MRREERPGKLKEENCRGDFEGGSWRREGGREGGRFCDQNFGPHLREWYVSLKLSLGFE